MSFKAKCKVRNLGSKRNISCHSLMAIIVTLSVYICEVSCYIDEHECEEDSDIRVTCLDRNNCSYACEEDKNLTFNGSELSTEASESWLTELSRKNLKHSVSYTIFMIIVYTFVFVLGIIGNSMVILAIALKSHMQTVTNLFLLNLAVADMFVLVFCLPATLIAAIIKSWILGSFMCWGVTYVQGISVVASAYSLAAISVDRCKAICQHIMTTQGFSQQQAKFIIFVIWILAVLIPLPWTFVFILKDSDENSIICTESWSSEELDIFYFVFGNLFCCYILPFLFIFCANVKIWLKVSGRKVPQASTPTTQASRLIQQSHQRTKKGVGRMLGMVTLTYLICWLPLYIVVTRLKLSKSTGESEKKFLLVVVPLAQWLAYWNSCVNPVFYAFYNANFRKMAKRFLPTWISRRFTVHRRASEVRFERRATLTLKVLDKNEHVQEALAIQDTSCGPSYETIQVTVSHEQQRYHCEDEDQNQHDISCNSISLTGNSVSSSLICASNSAKITAV